MISLYKKIFKTDKIFKNLITLERCITFLFLVCNRDLFKNFILF
jgi:hypothetical protein